MSLLLDVHLGLGFWGAEGALGRIQAEPVPLKGGPRNRISFPGDAQTIHVSVPAPLGSRTLGLCQSRQAGTLREGTAGSAALV